MCLNTTEYAVQKFKEDHRNDGTFLVWKIYRKVKKLVWSRTKGYHQVGNDVGLIGRYASIIYNAGLSGAYIKKPGVVKSNRQYKELIDRAGNYPMESDYRPDDDLWYSSLNAWNIKRGIHVYTTRERAKEVFEEGQGLDPREYVVVCCHANIDDLVGVEDRYKTAVFMKVSISPRNFRRATRGK